MNTRIINEINKIEHEKGIRILYACETGSRAWGFPSPDSDYDVRMIYMHELPWYISLRNKKDSIAYMSEDRELDITGWDIKKCLGLLWKSNGALLERIQSPIVYRSSHTFIADMQQMAERCFSPIATMHHYLGLAEKSFNGMLEAQEVKLKGLFYALRASLACKWILEKDAIPPIVFQKMLAELTIPSEIKAKVKALLQIKSKEKEDYLHPREEDILEFIQREIVIAKDRASLLASRREREVDLDAFLYQIITTYRNDHGYTRS